MATTISVNIPQLIDSKDVVMSASMTPSPFVFLKTAIAPIISRQGSIGPNILLDEGSQRTFITRRMANLAKAKVTRRERLSLSGFAAVSQLPSEYEIVDLKIVTRDKSVVLVKAVTVGQIANTLDDKYRDAITTLSHLQNLDITHQHNGIEMFEIEVLIGADFF